MASTRILIEPLGLFSSSCFPGKSVSHADTFSVSLSYILRAGRSLVESDFHSQRMRGNLPSSWAECLVLPVIQVAPSSSCDRSRWRAKPNAVTKRAIPLQLFTTRRHFRDDVCEIALVNRDLRTFAQYISFQQKRGDKHNHRAHCQQPVHIDVRENCSLGLNHSIQSAQGLLLSGVRV